MSSNILFYSLVFNYLVILIGKLKSLQKFFILKAEFPERKKYFQPLYQTNMLDKHASLYPYFPETRTTNIDLKIKGPDAE